jgi:RND family efflux transporter MFP subunit
MQLRAWQAISLSAILSVMAACERQAPEPAQQWLPVRVQTLTGLEDTEGVRYSASITPNRQVDLKFKVNGYIDSILQVPGGDGTTRTVNPGDTVSEGMALAGIQEDEYSDRVGIAEADLAAAKAALVKAQQDYKRARDLYATQSMTAPDFDAAQQEYSTALANVKGAQAKVAESRQNLAYCTLQAPMDGVLLQRNIEIGTLVMPDTVAFVLADMSTVKVVFAVPDIMLKNIAEGDVLNVTTRSQPGKVFSGPVTTITPAADTRTRVFDIEITLPNPDGLLKDGMVAALQVPELTAQTRVALAVPIAAVVRDPGDPQGYAVYVVDRREEATLARIKVVRLGEVHGNRVAVTAGLNAGEQVIVSGASKVRDGLLIRILD